MGLYGLESVGLHRGSALLGVESRLLQDKVLLGDCLRLSSARRSWIENDEAISELVSRVEMR